MELLNTLDEKVNPLEMTFMHMMDEAFKQISATNVDESKYSVELCDEIITRISEGEPLRQICRDEHMSSWSAVYRWEQEHPEFKERIAHARRGHGKLRSKYQSLCAPIAKPFNFLKCRKLILVSTCHCPIS